MSAMTSVGAFEAKTHLSALLDRVERGEQVTITRHGRPVAKLVPTGDFDRADARAALESMRAGVAALAKTIDRPFTIEEIIALKNEGRH